MAGLEKKRRAGKAHQSSQVVQGPPRSKTAWAGLSPNRHKFKDIGLFAKPSNLTGSLPDRIGRLFDCRKHLIKVCEVTGKLIPVLENELFAGAKQKNATLLPVIPGA